MLKFMLDSVSIRSVKFGQARIAKLLTVPAGTAAEQILACLNLPTPKAVLVLNGGASNLDADVSKRLISHFEALASFVVAHSITVVTGGTNSGVFRIFGEALAKAGGATAPCLGVTIDVPERLEPNHTHFVLVRAKEWGMETATMYSLVAQLSRAVKSIAVFAGGGMHSLNEMRWNVQQGRKMVFIEGSKGYTDRVLHTEQPSDSNDADLDSIRQGGLILPFRIEKDGDLLINLITQKILGSS